MWARILTLLSLSCTSLSLSTSLPNKLKPSKVIFLKMQLPHRFDPAKLKKLVAAHSKGESNENKLVEAFSKGGINENKLFEAFSKAGINLERSRRGKQGRDMGKIDPYTWKPKTSHPTLNYIQTSGVEDKPWQQMTQSGPGREPGQIYRPQLSFMSNAKPSLLSWRELEVKETPIIRAKPFSLDYGSRLKKKYESQVPVHLGYSRNFVDETPSPAYRGAGSTTTWLRYPVNGLPRTLKHWQYPLKVARLVSNSV